MKQVFDRKGAIEVQEVPPPALESGRILVQTAFSCISPGTELAGLRSSATPLWRKALQKPQHVKKVFDIAREKGIGSALDAIETKTAGFKALGYSLSGVVVGLGEGVTEFKLGDRVACVGSQCAFHAELVTVPVNLAVRLPEKVSTQEAATVALGAIALQGVRRAEVTFGETVLVIGLGVLGQLTARLLRASGCRVIGSDLNPERIALAKENGMQGACAPGGDLVQETLMQTEGVGADAVIVTASSGDQELMHRAFLACKKRGKVVLVGDVPLNFRREDLYEKELEFRISTSYGPGRYDHSFEEKGVDYPFPYVRWTETRNMAAYLDAIANGAIRVGDLIGATHPVTAATAAFAGLREAKVMTALLSYDGIAVPSAAALSASPRATASGGNHPLRLALLGAGSFTEAVHLPNLKKLSEQFQLEVVANRTGHKALNLSQRFGIRENTTDWQAPLRAEAVEAVLIATRHDLHAPMTLEALRAGKHVLVEKPLALTSQELKNLRGFYAETDRAPLLMTGYNRRFSPAAQRAKKLLERRKGPAILQYTMNAGFLPADHWVHGSEGGGRNLGEACHIYDLFIYLLGSHARRKVTACSIGFGASPFRPGDNFQAGIEFADGSVASLVYTAMGNSGLEKEELKAFFDGQVFLINDYKTSTHIAGPGRIGVTKHDSKGHYEELQEFHRGIRDGHWPIPLEEQFASAEIALEVEGLLRSNASAHQS